jgi:hypothetical protein
MVVTLNFEQVGEYPYPPVNDPNPTLGSGAAMTACKLSGDPMLAFLVQTGNDDEIVFLNLHLSVLNEQHRIVTPSNREVITGLCYQKSSGLLWAGEQHSVDGNGVEHGLEFFSIDPVSGNEVSQIAVPPEDADGLAFNGLHFVRASGNTLEAIAQNGTVLGARQHTGKNYRGISVAYWSYVAADETGSRLAVLNPFGIEIAECNSVPGTAGGMEAVAYDNIHDFDHIAQLPTENGAIGDPGTLFHPDTPWNPVPWTGRRHNIYIANQTDQIIYYGYLYE